jgi:hypothetical protein
LHILIFICIQVFLSAQ